MSIFGSILSKLGLGGDEEVVVSADTTVATPSAAHRGTSHSIGRGSRQSG